MKTCKRKMPAQKGRGGPAPFRDEIRMLYDRPPMRSCCWSRKAFSTATRRPWRYSAARAGGVLLESPGRFVAAAPAGRHGFPDAGQSANCHRDGKRESLFEWMHKRADTGEVFPADVMLSAMELDGKRVLQATVRDLTSASVRKKRSARRWRCSARFLTAQSTYWAVDAQDFRLLTFNARSATIPPATRQAPQVGQRPEELLPNAEYIQSWHGYFQRALASGHLPRNTSRLRAKSRFS